MTLPNGDSLYSESVMLQYRQPSALHLLFSVNPAQIKFIMRCQVHFGFTYGHDENYSSNGRRTQLSCNVQFERDATDDAEWDVPSEDAKISHASKASLTTACGLLGLDEEKVKEAILTKLLTIGGKTIHKPKSVSQAADKRDAFAKSTYACLFLCLVQRINETLDTIASPKTADDDLQEDAQQRQAVGYIGLLNIYGFETFDVNGYEQMLINYCNEKVAAPL